MENFKPVSVGIELRLQTTLVKKRCTLSITAMSLLRCGDQTLCVILEKGATYVQKARTKSDGILLWKDFRIRDARLNALADIDEQ